MRRDYSIRNIPSSLDIGSRRHKETGGSIHDRLDPACHFVIFLPQLELPIDPGAVLFSAGYTVRMAPRRDSIGACWNSRPERTTVSLHNTAWEFGLTDTR